MPRSLDSLYDRAKQALMWESDRAHVLRETRRAAPGEAARRALAGKTAAPGRGGVRWAGGGAGLPRLRGLARAQYRHEPLAAESPERG
ncbi:hypothetical protein U6X32_12225 [Cutibacterium acnes]